MLDRSHAHWRPLLIGTLAVSFAVMVRPANVFALAAWFICAAIALIARGAGKTTIVRSLVLAVAAASLPMAPQYINNVRTHGVATPLLASPLGHFQQIWGLQYLKYATALPPVPYVSIFYENPFVKTRPVDQLHPLRWYVDYPAAGIATGAAHVFGMLDQDLLFTYSRDLRPWYRLPVTLFNHLLIALAATALIRLLRSTGTPRIVGTALVVAIACNAAVHATTAVEMRFGLPLLVIALPLTAWLAIDIGRRALAPRTCVFIAMYAASAFAASDWIRDQAPAIRGATLSQAWHG
jgi:hypothetical protein